MRTRKTNSLAKNEKGFASLVIALVLIVILALLTVGFAKLARREQQSALDKQLSTQAYYAAESGINDAVKDINSGAINTTNTSPTTCMTATTATSGTKSLDPATALTANSNVNQANGVSYTCLLVNLRPSSLVFDDTPPGSGQYLSFSIAGPVPLKTLTVQWKSHDGQNSLNLTSRTYLSDQKFPNQTTWNTANWPPALQFSLTPTKSGVPIKRSDLIDNTFNTYLYPANDGSNTVAFDTANQGQIVSGKCSTTNTYYCGVTITGLSALGNSYILHYLDFYDATDVYVTGTDANDKPVNFTGQAQVDVTGKAQNVLKRLQVRLDADGANGTIVDPPLLPDDALQAQNICKRLQTAPVIPTSNPSGTSFIDPSGSSVTTGSCYPEL